ncbi:MAG: hypothetical protein NVSMB29_14250 [Candidatus Dormibacteria bacterium]
MPGRGYNSLPSYAVTERVLSDPVDKLGKNMARTPANVVTLGVNDALVGTLRVEGDLNVHGSAEGEVIASGDVAIESTAHVQAAIEARNLSVRGDVTGSVKVHRRLRLSGTGSLNGDARVGRLVVEDGASLNGSITMTSPGEASEPAEEEQAPVEADSHGEMVLVGEHVESNNHAG